MPLAGVQQGEAGHRWCDCFRRQATRPMGRCDLYRNSTWIHRRKSSWPGATQVVDPLIKLGAHSPEGPSRLHGPLCNFVGQHHLNSSGLTGCPHQTKSSITAFVKPAVGPSPLQPRRLLGGVHGIAATVLLYDRPRRGTSCRCSRMGTGTLRIRRWPTLPKATSCTKD